MDGTRLGKAGATDGLGRVGGQQIHRRRKGESIATRLDKRKPQGKINHNTIKGRASVVKLNVNRLSYTIKRQLAWV